MQSSISNGIKKNSAWLVVCCFLLSVASCEDAPPGYRFEKVREIAIQPGPGKIVCEIADLKLDPQGNFYLVDRRCHTVFVLDRQGQFIQQIGSEGRGPGELLNPAAVAFVGDTLAILDAGNRRVSFFNQAGVYLSSVHVQGAYLSGVVFNESGRMIVSESLGIENYSIYTRSGKRITELQKPHVSQVTLPVRMQGGQMSQTSQGSILFSGIRNYFVVELDWQGDTLTVYQADPPGYSPPDLSSRQRFMKQASWAIVGKPLQLHDMVLIQWAKRSGEMTKPAEASWKRYVDLFTPEGKQITLAIPAPVSFLFVNEGLLYGIDDSKMKTGVDNPSIVAYRLRQAVS